MNPRGKWIHLGFCSFDCTKAFEKSTDTVLHPSIRQRTKKRRTVLHATVGANVSSSSYVSSRSPLTQYLALNFLISPLGVRLTRNTQVPGMILSLASDIGTCFKPSCLAFKFFNLFLRCLTPFLSIGTVHGFIVGE